MLLTRRKTMSVYRSVKVLSLFIWIAVFAFVTAVPKAEAQSVPVLKYGDVVTVDITTSTPSQSYTFSGKKGDVVVLTLSSNIPNGDNADYSKLSSGLQVTDSAGNKVITQLEDCYRCAAQLVADGTYTVTVMPSKNASADSKVGKFFLTLSQATVLQPDQIVQATVKKWIPMFYLTPNHQRFILDFAQTPKEPSSYLNLEFYQTGGDSGDFLGSMFGGES